MPRRPRTVALGLLLGSFCLGRGARAQAPAAAPAATPAPVAVLALPAPAQVGRYIRGARRDFGSPELGVSYVYADSADSGAVRLNAYFYERGPDARDLPAADALAREVAGFREALEVERARGVLDAYTIATGGADTVAVPGSARRAVPGYWLAVPLRRRGQVYVSFYHVYAVGNGFVKVRGTVPEAGWGARGIPEFARALVRQVLGAPGP